MMMNNKIINWFIPANKIRGRTNVEIARLFVFTHLFGPFIAQPMGIYLYFISPELSAPLMVMVFGIYSFALLPFVLKWTGNMNLSALLSYQGLASASLFGTFFYGGFSSPFLPWLIVSLLLGFFYLSKKPFLVIGLFATDLAIFITVLFAYGLPNLLPAADLRFIGWLSLISSTVYMTWMALYYARMIALKSELQIEAERYRSTLSELEQARSTAEKINRHRSLFFSKMSHELRTPLNVIIGYSEILLEDCEQSDSHREQSAQDLARINAAGKHLLSLVAKVLDADQIETEATTIDVARFSLGELCDDVVANAMPMIEKNGSRMVLDCPDRSYFIETDRTKLMQMLINLLSNAGKFTSNGTVTLRLAIEHSSREDRLIASVRDTGIGISEEVMPRLFQDYIQADASIAKRFGGTGIGLAITRKFSLLLGGEVNVTSKSGDGSCFTIDIPAQLQLSTDADMETNSSDTTSDFCADEAA